MTPAFVRRRRTTRSRCPLERHELRTKVLHVVGRVLPSSSNHVEPGEPRTSAVKGLASGRPAADEFGLPARGSRLRRSGKTRLYGVRHGRHGVVMGRPYRTRHGAHAVEGPARDEVPASPPRRRARRAPWRGTARRPLQRSGRAPRRARRVGTAIVPRSIRGGSRVSRSRRLLPIQCVSTRGDAPGAAAATCAVHRERDVEVLLECEPHVRPVAARLRHAYRAPSSRSAGRRAGCRPRGAAARGRARASRCHHVRRGGQPGRAAELGEPPRVRRSRARRRTGPRRRRARRAGSPQSATASSSDHAAVGSRSRARGNRACERVDRRHLLVAARRPPSA
jgi:hypothetical protein